MMRRRWWMWLVAAAAWVAGAATIDRLSGAGAGEAGVERGALKALSVGQSVKLSQAGSSVIIAGVPRGVSTPLKVTELGRDYVVLTDSAGIATVIPVTAIKSIVIPR